MLRLKILEVKQPLGVFYITKINASTLLKIVEADPYQAMPDGTFTGIQRINRKERLKEISMYLLGTESAMPNSIIIAGNTKSLDDHLTWRLENDGENKYLIIPELIINGTIIDGQHRLKAFELIPIENQNEYELLCSIYIDLPDPYQAYLFATININQKSVDRSLAYQLYGYNLDDENNISWSPEKLAVYLTRKLNFDKDSIFYNHILVAAQNDEILFEVSPKQQEWYVSTASIVDGILLLISSNPKKDRDLLQQMPIEIRKRALLGKDKSPLREYYIQRNDKLIYLIVTNFFKASFGTLYFKDSYLFKTVGIQAQFGLLKVILEKNLSRDKDISVAYYSNILTSCKNIDFNDNFFTASGLGKSHIYNSLLLRLGYKSLEDINRTQDVENYRRLLKI